MKDNLTQNKSTQSVMPFLLSQSGGGAVNIRPQLAGFAKVINRGKVVGLNKSASFVDRMIGVHPAQPSTGASSKCIEQMILESVATNLEAGVKLLDKQEFVLAQMGGRLSEIALSINRSRELPEQRKEEQLKFNDAREKLRALSKETFDHTALFSMGAAKPITVAVPGRNKWEGLSIDRCDLAKPGWLSIDRGKVCPDALGLLLDPQVINRAFSEWREHCASNRLQWQLIYERWQSMVSTLKSFIGGKKWSPPPLPRDDDSGPLSRPHLDN